MRKCHAVRRPHRCGRGIGVSKCGMCGGACVGMARSEGASQVRVCGMFGEKMCENTGYRCVGVCLYAAGGAYMQAVITRACVCKLMFVCACRSPVGEVRPMLAVVLCSAVLCKIEGTLSAVCYMHKGALDHASGGARYLPLHSTTMRASRLIYFLFV